VSSGNLGLSWAGIARLGLVQVAIGAVIVLMTSTLNRVMVVELALPAMIPGALVGLHFAMQLLRPRMGFGSDQHGKRIPWIVGGMAVVCLSGLGAAAATALMATHRGAGVALAILAFALLGVGVSASSTPFLAFLAERVDEKRMAGAAAMTWILMIVGIIITASVAGSLLDPFSMGRMVAVTAGVCAAAMTLTLLAVVGRTDDGVVVKETLRSRTPDAGFRAAFQEMWSDRDSRIFASFIFLSMLAYSAQDIILEPFAGAVFGLTPGESTAIAGLQHGGVLAGMIGGALLARGGAHLPRWAAVGCAASALALVALVLMPVTGSVSGLRGSVFALGLANGLYAVSAIGAMMGLTVRGRVGGAGLRMGFWGAAQAAAYGLGGFLGAAASDAGRALLSSPALGYGVVFAGQAVLFLVAAAVVLVGVKGEEARGSQPLRQAGEAMVLQG
jgi:MFS transporter, BCD family, chlorophyll transporter